MYKKDNKDIKNNKSTKEEFCPVCVAVPLALAGAGATSLGANQSENYKKRRKNLLFVGISSTVISLLIIIYYVWIKDCESCK